MKNHEINQTTMFCPQCFKSLYASDYKAVASRPTSACYWCGFIFIVADVNLPVYLKELRGGKGK